MHAGQFAGGHLSTPLQPPLPYQAEQVARPGHGPDCDIALNNGAAVGSYYLGVFQAHLLRIECRLGRIQPGAGRLLQRQHLLDLLVAQSTGVLQAAGAIGIGLCLVGVGLRLGHAGTRNRYICQHAVGCKSSQYLAALHRLPHIDPHIIHP